ncbi:hypothetical protein EfmE1071_0908 [Enterococcus faecium E1071]|nr:hypothetical protein EfmE1071_0908 [Enterococcus faecium E1071]
MGTMCLSAFYLKNSLKNICFLSKLEKKKFRKFDNEVLKY